MTYANISESVASIIEEYGLRDPYGLCEQMGIKVLFQPLGTEPEAIKGFFIEFMGVRTITVNSDLPEVMQRIIAAHELCHAIHHRTEGSQAFHEYTMFDQNSILEKEANLFAAELLLDDTEVFEVLNQDTTFFSAAAKLLVPAELLDFKFRLMKWKGYKLIEPPMTTRSNFLLNVEVPYEASYYN